MMVALVGALALTFGTATMAAAADLPDDGDAVATAQSQEAPAADATAADATAAEDPAADESAADDSAAEDPGAPPTDEAADPAAEPAPEGLPETPDEGAVADEGDETPEAETQGDAEEMALLGVPSESKSQGYDKDKDKVTLCHATGQGKGWVVVRTDEDGALGHAGWKHQQGKDIIPPFSYRHNGHTVNFAGQNWDAEGQAIWNNGCEKPQTPPSISVTVDQCTVPGGEPSGTVLVTLSDLVRGKHYTVTIFSMGEPVSSEHFVANGSTAQFDMGVPGAGDAYSATVTQKWSELSGSTEFQVLPCPPMPELTISGEAGQCVVPGGTGTAIVTVGGLVSDGVYTVTLWLGEELVGSQTLEHPEDPGAVLTFDVTKLGDYTAEITGEAMMATSRTMHGWPEWPEWPEPQPVPSASVVFQAGSPCPVPPTPATPALVKAAPPMLAVTGSGAPAGALLAGGLLLALGGATVLAQRIRRAQAGS